MPDNLYAILGVAVVVVLFGGWTLLFAAMLTRDEPPKSKESKQALGDRP